jgi:hypothetical protein
MNKKFIIGLVTVGMAFAMTFTGAVCAQKTKSNACEMKPSIMEECDLVMEKELYYYEGNRVEPQYKLMHGDKELVNGVDYYAEIYRNDGAGTAKLKLQGQGDYVGTIHQEFIIKDLNATENKKISFSNACTAELVGQDFYYDGFTPVSPEVVVKYGEEVLKKDVDYTLRYVHNEAYGGAYAELWGAGRFYGRIDVDFLVKKPNAGRVNKVNMALCDIKVEKKCYEYTGQEIKAKVIVTDKGSNKELTEGVDYTVSYSKNVKQGTAKVKVTGIGEYKGSIKEKFVIR